MRKRKTKSIDIKYLCKWTHKLYKIAKERDSYVQKLLYAKRAFIFAFTEPYNPKKRERINYYEEIKKTNMGKSL